MSFLFLFLLFILLYLIVIPIIRGIFFYKRIQNNFRNGFSDLRKSQFDNNGQPFPKRKIFSADYGEYVKFEEINIGTSTYKETHDDSETDLVLMEEQTVDVEWEEICDDKN